MGLEEMSGRSFHGETVACSAGEVVAECLVARRRLAVSCSCGVSLAVGAVSQPEDWPGVAG